MDNEPGGAVPRPEHPRPQFVRDAWLSLNGIWQFEIDRGDAGLERGLLSRPLADKIVVPFCPEAALSGIGEQDFMEAVWYRREVEVAADWFGRRLLLHFQAVDHDTTVWVNGAEAARHRGGFTPFTADLGIASDDNAAFSIVVRARDPRSGAQARGKQSTAWANAGAVYTRTTGIWQTVWMEAVPPTYLLRPRITADPFTGTVDVEVGLRGPSVGLSVRATLSDDGHEIARQTVECAHRLVTTVTLGIPEPQRRMWTPGDPHLYDLVLETVDANGRVDDRAESYVGLRSIGIDGTRVLLNGRPIFQRLVADQGYYPDGIMTAPSDEALVHDIEIAQAAGFNGARLHQKVFEERYLYHCDRLGYLVWGEFPDWGAFLRRGAQVTSTASLIPQWLEQLDRDYSHPAIVGWCPLNETLEALGDRITELDDITRAMFLATKAADGTRPVLDVSGFSHRIHEADIYDSHDYVQDPETFAAHLQGLGEGHPFTSGDPGDPALEPMLQSGVGPGPWSVRYAGQPYFCSEFGGIIYKPELADDLIVQGYVGPLDVYTRVSADHWRGRIVATEQEFLDRFSRLVSIQLENPDIFAYSYFQLYDTYQEYLGIYSFDRAPKFEIAKIRDIQSRPAAIETNGQ